jgi:DNA-binding GntR family transcriptional regulator
VHAECGQRLTDLLQLEGFDNGDNEFHDGFIRSMDNTVLIEFASPSLTPFRANRTKNLQSGRKTCVPVYH